MKKQIRFSEFARDDLKQIYRYIANDSPARGRKLIVEITQCCEQTIAEYPQIGRVRPEIYQDLRSLAFKRYVIFYRELAAAIEIVRVLHGSRDVDLAFF
jgi:toxin ParE1/3/4